MKGSKSDSDYSILTHSPVPPAARLGPGYSQEPGIPFGWQGPKPLNHKPLLPGMHQMAAGLEVVQLGLEQALRYGMQECKQWHNLLHHNLHPFKNFNKQEGY